MKLRNHEVSHQSTRANFVERVYFCDFPISAFSTVDSETDSSTFGAGNFSKAHPRLQNMSWKHCNFLPAKDKQNATFLPDFTQPGKSLLEISCRLHVAAQRKT